jgi:hypothetical protein
MLPEYFYHTPKGKSSKIGFQDINREREETSGLVAQVVRALH